MEFLLFFVFLFFTFSVVALLSYYIRLFSNEDKDNFTKQELIELQRIIPMEKLQLFESEGSIQFGLAAFFVSIALTYLWTLSGGLIGPPHYTNDFGNYFFLSFILFLALTLSYPYLYDAFLNRIAITDSRSIIVQFFKQENNIIMGCGITLIAANLTIYGMYHEIYFISVISNIAIIGIVLLYKLSGKTIPWLPYFNKPLNQFEDVDIHIEDDDELMV